MHDQEFRWELFTKVVPVIEKFPGQRPLNLERVMEIKTSLHSNIRNFGSLRLRQPIYLGFIPDSRKDHLGFSSGTYYLLDGQHRFECLRQLILPKIIPDQTILVSIIMCRDEHQLRTEFNNINNVTPMLACYTHPSDVIDLAVKRFANRYPNLKDGVGHRKRPNASIDIIRSTLITSRIIDQYKITDYERLFEILETLQTWYSTWSWDNFVSVLVCKPDDERIMGFWTRIKAGNLSYLGMFTSKQTHIWLSHLSHILTGYIKA